MAKENKDLKERIAMCTEEYKTLLLETGRLQRKLEKHYKGKDIYFIRLVVYNLKRWSIIFPQDVVKSYV